MEIKLYHFGPSPPSSAALLAARAVGIDFEIKIIDLAKMEQFSPDFLKVFNQLSRKLSNLICIIFFRSIPSILYRL